MENNENEKLNEIKKDVVGPAFNELSTEEMEESQGSGDVQQETTPTCIIASGALISAGISWLTAEINKK